MKIYISDKLGSVYWLENNALMFAPMPINGFIDTEGEGGEVDFYLLDGERTESGENIVDILNDIKNKLK